MESTIDDLKTAMAGLQRDREERGRGGALRGGGGRWGNVGAKIFRKSQASIRKTEVSSEIKRIVIFYSVCINNH